MKIVKRKKYTPIWSRIIVTLLSLVLILGVSFIGLQHLNKALFNQKKFYNEIHSESIIENSPTNVFIEYPITGNDPVNVFIKKYIETQYQNFKDEIIEDESLIYEYNISYKSIPYNETIVSFYFDKYQNNSGLAHGIANIDTFTFDMKTGNLLVLEDIFEDELSFNLYKETLKEHISKVVSSDPHSEPFLSDEQMNKLLDDSLIFSLTEDSLIVYFEPYEIAPGYMSTQEIEIEIDKIEGIKIDRLNDVEPENSFGISATLLYDEFLNEERVQDLKTKKLVALTFDDGPHKTLTPRLLSILKDNDVKATFYVLGSRVEREPLILKKALLEGHAIGSHSYSHQNLSTLSEEQVISEIKRTQDVIEMATGQKPTTLRPPYGAYNDIVLRNADAPIAMWSVDTLDWKNRNSQIVTQTVKENVKDGSIILMHDIHQTTVDSVQGIIDALKQEGYTFVTVDQMLEVRQGMENSKIYYSGVK